MCLVLLIALSNYSKMSNITNNLNQLQYDE